jgi:hypothetical protein
MTAVCIHGAPNEWIEMKRFHARVGVISAALLLGVALPATAQAAALAPAPLASTTVTPNQLPPPDPNPPADVVTYSDADLTVVGEGGALTGLQPNTKVTCGYVSCSLYFSKKQTAWMKHNIDVVNITPVAAVLIVCTIATAIAAPSVVGAAIVAIVCGVEGAVYTGFLLNAINHAGDDHGCLRIRAILPNMLAFYDDHSVYCK